MFSDVIKLVYSSVKTICAGFGWLCTKPTQIPSLKLYYHCQSLIYWVINSYFRVKVKVSHIFITRQTGSCVNSEGMGTQCVITCHHILNQLQQHKKTLASSQSSARPLIGSSYFDSLFNPAFIIKRALTYSILMYKHWVAAVHYPRFISRY